MSNETVLIIGGFYNVVLVVFHLLFWKLFNWKKSLKKLLFVDRATMQVLNLALTFVFVIFAYISFFHSNELVTTSLGKSLLKFMSVFWFLRAAYQIIFYGLKNKTSIFFFVYFFCGGVIYLYSVI